MTRRRRSSHSDDQRKRRHDTSGKEREERARRRSREQRKRNEEKKSRADRDRIKRRTRSRSGGSRATSREGRPKHRVEDDRDGHLIYRPLDVIEPSDGSSGCYKIIRDLGEGTFGKVVEVETRSEKRLALKIIRNVSRYRDAANYEIRILNDLKKADPSGSSLIIQLLNYFDYHGHPCLVFPLLGQSVFEFLKHNDYIPFPLAHVRHIGYQLTHSVSFMHRHRLTHTDLKPENLMFRSTKYHTEKDDRGRKVRIVDNPDVVLIDLGGATYENEHHTTVVSTRHYRAPEVILELGWSHPCDVWSIGCILFELYTGNTLFQTHDSREHLAIMEKALGAMPESMAIRSKPKHFKNGKLIWDSSVPDARYVRDKCFPLEHHLKRNSPEDQELFDLIKQMLVYNPEKRIDCEGALRHPFFDSMHNGAETTAPVSQNGVAA